MRCSIKRSYKLFPFYNYDKKFNLIHISKSSHSENSYLKQFNKDHDIRR